MVAKLCPDVLDKLDIFVLEIEELEIPKVIQCFNLLRLHNIIEISNNLNKIANINLGFLTF